MTVASGKVFAAGFSAGGMLVETMACKYPKSYNGYAVVGGALVANADHLDSDLRSLWTKQSADSPGARSAWLCNRIWDLQLSSFHSYFRFLKLHGTSDDLVNYDTGAITAHADVAQSIPTEIKGWKTRAGCQTQTTHKMKATGSVDYCAYSFTNCNRFTERSMIQLVRMKNGEHLWPGFDNADFRFHATTYSWNFFMWGLNGGTWPINEKGIFYGKPDAQWTSCTTSDSLCPVL
jgi:poly(3-hydroxybutyrate) depolymerase